MPENLRGTLTPFTLPPKSEVWPELQGPIEEYRDLIQKRRLAQARLGKLENDRTHAVESDRHALAKALREGAPDPGDKKVEKIDRELANTRRTIDALEIAIYEAEADLIGVVDEHQSEWLENAAATIEQVAQEYLGAIEAIEAAREKLISSVALKRFLHTFPEHGYQAGHWPVYGLIARNEEPFRWDQVTEALRKDAEVATRPLREPQPEATGPIVEHLHNAPGMDEVAFGPGAVRSY